jgi:hypothetical protein
MAGRSRPLDSGSDGLASPAPAHDVLHAPMEGYIEAKHVQSPAAQTLCISKRHCSIVLSAELVAL